MVRIPTYQGGVEPGITPSVRAPRTPAGYFGEGLAAGMEQAAGTLYQVERHARNEAAELASENALNKLEDYKTILTFDPKEGFQSQLLQNALPDDKGRSLEQRYLERFQARTDEIRSTLTDREAIKRFDRKVPFLQDTFRKGLLNHESDQLNKYARTIDDATLKTTWDTAGKYWNDPEAIQVQMERVNAVLSRARTREGLSGVALEDLERSFKSPLHASVLSAAMANKALPFAEKYLKANAHQMSLNDQLKFAAEITKKAELEADERIADTVFEEARPAINPSDMDRFQASAGAFRNFEDQAEELMAPLVQVESGGRQSAVSKKGALGLAQIMPSTGPEAAKLAGLPWKPELLGEDSAEGRAYNRALGRAYLSEQLRVFNGDPAKALAAYNGGASRVIKAVSESPIDVPGAWLDHPAIPKESREYVQKVLKNFSSGVNPVKAPGLTELQDRAEMLAGDNPERRRAVRKLVESRYDDIQKAKRADEDAAENDAIRLIDQNKGQGGLDALPLALNQRLSGKAIKTLRGYANDLASGKDIETDLALYERLAQPDFLKNLNDQQFFALRPKLATADFKHFANERTKLKTGQSGNPWETLDTAGINAIVNTRLQSLGIDPTPKDTNTKEMARVGNIRKFINNALLAQQSSSRTALKDKALTEAIDGLFAQKIPLQGAWGSAIKRTPSVLEVQAKEITGPTRQAIEQDFKRRGLVPTDSDIQMEFFKKRTNEQTLWGYGQNAIPGPVRLSLMADFQARGVNPSEGDLLGAYVELVKRGVKR